MHTAAEWLAQLPAQISPRQGLVYIAQVLDDAKEATSAILAEYHGGTLPPPPWPQPPELQTAIAALEGGRSMLNTAIALGYGDKSEPQSGSHAARLINGGKAVYAGIAQMQRERREGKIDPAQVPAKAAAWAATKLKDIAATQIGGWLVFAGVVWLLHNLDDLE
jgi:hypothetical protein